MQGPCANQPKSNKRIKMTPPVGGLAGARLPGSQYRPIGGIAFGKLPCRVRVRADQGGGGHDAERRDVVRGSRTPNCRAAAAPDADSAWERLQLAKRQLGVALAEEDYALCSSLKAEIKAHEGRLPARKQLLLALLDRLRHGTERERLTSAQSLGELGDPEALPVLQEQLTLSEGDLGATAEASMWSIFMHPPSEEVGQKMHKAMTLMSRSSEWERAVAAFTELIDAAPSFAEGRNKRATTYYLMQRHEEAIQDCQMVLQLNPYHFGAASGMGLCYAAIHEYTAAIEAFETAMTINPRLTHLRHHIMQLKQQQRDENRQQ